ncbi:MAG: hypothetical protein AAF533_24420, partial [Acidobacteriota bacterium]
MCRSRPSFSFIAFAILLLAPPASAGDEPVWVPLDAPIGDHGVIAVVPLLPGEEVAVERASAGTFLTSDAGASWQSR